MPWAMMVDSSATTGAARRPARRPRGALRASQRWADSEFAGASVPHCGQGAIHQPGGRRRMRSGGTCGTILDPFAGSTFAPTRMGASPVLDPVDRVCELCFGLFMALTFVGAVSAATATATTPAADAHIGRTVLHGARLQPRLGTGGCGDVPGAHAHRPRPPRAACRLHPREHGPCTGRRPAARRALERRRKGWSATPRLEGIRALRIAAAAHAARGSQGLILRDYLAAASVFALVVLGTFPVALPFILIQETKPALIVSARAHAGDAVCLRPRARPPHRQRRLEDGPGNDGAGRGAYGGDHPARRLSNRGPASPHFLVALWVVAAVQCITYPAPMRTPQFLKFSSRTEVAAGTGHRLRSPIPPSISRRRWSAHRPGSVPSWLATAASACAWATSLPS